MQTLTANYLGEREVRKTFATIFLAHLVVGCASGELAGFESYAVPQSSLQRTVGTNPTISTLSRASVGQVIFEDFNYISKNEPDHFRVVKPVNVSVAPAMSVKASLETKIYAITDGKFCINNYGKDCFYDTNSDGKFETVSTQPGLIRFEKELETPVEYYETRGEQTITDKGGYRREIIYQGRDGNTLRAKYREFSNNLARPAFTQDLTYPINDDNQSEIVFQNVSISVHEVSNTKVSYTVNSDRF